MCADKLRGDEIDESRSRQLRIEGPDEIAEALQLRDALFEPAREEADRRDV